MGHYGNTSRERLDTCCVEMRDLFNDVVQGFDNSIICGWRGEADQNAAFAAGNSEVQWPNSDHNRMDDNGNPNSDAVDACPYLAGGAVMPDISFEEAVRRKDFVIAYQYMQIMAFVGYVLATARKRGIAVGNGSDWDGDWDIKEHKFKDFCHFFIKRS